jgi:hypothetical protein
MRKYPPARGWVTEHGYRRFTGKDRKRRLEHVMVWEAANGPVPAGFEIHHINGDKLDNRLENLRLVTRLEHKRVHSGCFRVGGNWLKRCRRCQWLRSVATEFYEYAGKNGAMGVCRRCASELAVEAKRKRKRSRRDQREA